MVSALGSESDDLDSSPRRGKALCPWDVREKKMRAPLLGLARSIYYSIMRRNWPYLFEWTPRRLLNCSWFVGGLYLKSNLFLANNSMVADHFNEKQKTCFSAFLKSHFLHFFSLSHVNTSVMQKANKDLISDVFSWHQNWDMSLSFEHTPHHAAAFINISPLKCGGYSRAALIRGSRLID